MKKKELTAFRNKKIDDLNKILREKRADAREAYSSIRAGQEKNIRKYKSLRREIAQILTIIREKEIITHDKSK